MTEKKRKTKGVPDVVDKHVGKRLRIRRSLLGMTQEKLADAVGVTFQQIQKYERGTNRVSAGRLLKFSEVLEVPLNYFYEDINSTKVSSKSATGFSDNDQEPFDTGAGKIYGETRKTGDEGKITDSDIFNRRETLDLVRAYYSISESKKRKDILKFIKSMTKNAL